MKSSIALSRQTIKNNSRHVYIWKSMLNLNMSQGGVRQRSPVKLKEKI